MYVPCTVRAVPSIKCLECGYDWQKWYEIYHDTSPRRHKEGAPGAEQFFAGRQVAICWEKIERSSSDENPLDPGPDTKNGSGNKRNDVLEWMRANVGLGQRVLTDAHIFGTLLWWGIMKTQYIWRFAWGQSRLQNKEVQYSRAQCMNRNGITN